MALAKPRAFTHEPALLPPAVRRREPVWRGYLMTEDEKRRINRMLTSALLDDSLCVRLVQHRDPALMSSFGLSVDTQRWIRELSAGSLDELASEIALQL